MAVTQESLDLWLGEDEVDMVVREGPSPTCQVTRLYWSVSVVSMVSSEPRYNFEWIIV